MEQIVMKRSTKANLLLGGWFLAIFLAIAGVSTWYSTNPTIMGAVVAFILMGGFLFLLKAASAFLFDNRNSFGLRFMSFVFLAGLVSVDIFSGSHSLQTGTMNRIVTETTQDSTYQTNLKSVQVLQQQLAECPPKYYKHCKKPLSQQLAEAQRALQASSQTTGSAEAKFWEALTNAVNSMTVQKVEMKDVVFYTYVFIMALASLLSIYAFGILGSAKLEDDEKSKPAPRDPEPTGTDSPPKKKSSFGFLGGKSSPATASSSGGTKAEATSGTTAKAVAPSTLAGDSGHSETVKRKVKSREPFTGKAYADEEGIQYRPIRDGSGQIIGQARSGATVSDFYRAFEKKHNRPLSKAGKPSKKPPLDITDTLSASPNTLVDKGNKVPTSPKLVKGDKPKPKITNQNSQELDDDIYQTLRSAILKEGVNPTFPKMEAFQKGQGLGSNNTERRSNSQTTFDRMCQEGTMIINPEYTHPRCGKQKYLVKEQGNDNQKTSRRVGRFSATRSP